MSWIRLLAIALALVFAPFSSELQAHSLSDASASQVLTGMAMGDDCDQMPTRSGDSQPVLKCCLAACAATLFAPFATASSLMVVPIEPVSDRIVAFDGVPGKVATPPPRRL